MLKNKLRFINSFIEDKILQFEFLYKYSFKLKYGSIQPKGFPSINWENSALRTRDEVEIAYNQVKKLGLPPVLDRGKNWDNLVALYRILNDTDKTGKILDAGAEKYSMLLPWLFLYGYKNLTGINIVFHKGIKRGPIRYEYGDITKTGFSDNTFDAISCLSVIEHGVDLASYFNEMARILKPNGVLITSTDYYVDPIDVEGKTAYGVPIHIFSKNEILSAIEVANKFNLELISSIGLECTDKPIYWEQFNLRYTFINFTLRKKT